MIPSQRLDRVEGVGERYYGNYDALVWNQCDLKKRTQKENLDSDKDAQKGKPGKPGQIILRRRIRFLIVLYELWIISNEWAAWELSLAMSCSVSGHSFPFLILLKFYAGHAEPDLDNHITCKPKLNNLNCNVDLYHSDFRNPEPPWFTQWVLTQQDER